MYVGGLKLGIVYIGICVSYFFAIVYLIALNRTFLAVISMLFGVIFAFVTFCAFFSEFFNDKVNGEDSVISAALQCQFCDV